MKLTREQQANAIVKLAYINKRQSWSSNDITEKVSIRTDTTMLATKVLGNEMSQADLERMVDLIQNESGRMTGKEANHYPEITNEAFQNCLEALLEVETTEVSTTEVDSQEIESIKAKIDELYECNSKSGAVRRIRNLENRLFDLPQTDEVSELIDTVAKESEFWKPYL